MDGVGIGRWKTSSGISLTTASAPTPKMTVPRRCGARRVGSFVFYAALRVDKIDAFAFDTAA